MTTSPNLNITYIDSAQAQKEVTANQAFDALELALTDTYAYQMPGDANQTPTAATALKCMVLVVTSAVSLTAQRDIILPLNEKIYCVKNSTTGTQNIRVKGATGTGVVIPKNAEVWVRCDATNFVTMGADTAGISNTSPFLLDGPAVPSGSLSSAINVRTLSATLEFITSAAANTPFAVKAAGFQSADIMQIKNSAGSVLSAFSSIGDLDMKNVRKLVNVVDPTSAQHGATKNYVDTNFAAINAQFLTKSSESGLSNEVPIDAITSTLVFNANNSTTVPLAARAAASVSVDVFQIQSTGGTVQAAFTSAFELDMKTHKIIAVVDPTSAQHAATKNYVDINTAGAIISFSADSLTVSVGTSYFAFPWFITTVAPTTERWIALPRGGVLRNLRVICAVAPAGGSVTFTVRKKTSGGGTGAGSDTAITCTVALGATEAHDTSNTVSVADGDEISIKIVENAGYSGSMVRTLITVELTRA